MFGGREIVGCDADRPPATSTPRLWRCGARAVSCPVPAPVGLATPFWRASSYLSADRRKSFTLFLASEVIVFAVAAVGQDWLIGRAGQVSVGGAAFVGVGAFATAATLHTPLQYFPLPLLISAIVGGVLGLVVGLPTLRVGGLSSSSPPSPFSTCSSSVRRSTRATTWPGSCPPDHYRRPDGCSTRSFCSSS